MLEIVGIALAGAALAARGSALRRCIVAVAGASILGLGVATGLRGTIVFAHLHNAIAFAWLLIAIEWWAYQRRVIE